MPKKKSVPRKKKGPRKQTISTKSQFVRIAAGVTILIGVVVAVAFVARTLFPTHPLTAKKAPVVQKVKPKSAAAPRPTFEVYPREAIAPPKPPLIPEKREATPLPLVALIIDDLGYDRKIANKFIELDVPLTFAVLPESPFRTKISGRAQAKGIELMLHLPMEPEEYPAINPGPGALLASMAPDQLIQQLNRDLDSIPNVKGVNNHMGSRMTKNSDQMRQIFSVLKQRGLFYVDSRTTAETLCRPSAQLLQVPFAERDVFIDHEPDPAFIRKQLDHLVRRAQRQGYAIGIGHPHLSTYEVLQQALPELLKAVELVPASRIIDLTG